MIVGNGTKKVFLLLIEILGLVKVLRHYPPPTPLPVGISDDLPWKAYGLEQHSSIKMNEINYIQLATFKIVVHNVGISERIPQIKHCTWVDLGL